MIAAVRLLTRCLAAALMLLMFATVLNAHAQESRAKVQASGNTQRPIDPPDEDPPFNYAGFASQAVPTTMTAGTAYTVTVRMRNSGTTTWTSAGAYALGSRNPFDNSTWGGGRVALAGAVAPGQTATFTFIVTAPAVAGSYNFQWAMVPDGVEWFGPPSENLVINVVAPARVNSAVIAGQNMPGQMQSGQTYPVTIVMQNTGNTTWTSADQYSFGIPTTNGVQLWNGGRVPLPGPVAPGGQAVFTFNVVAPPPGNYTFWGLMVQDGVEWFGQGTNLSISVSAPPSNGAQVTAISVPVLVQGQGATISVTVLNTGSTLWPAGSNYKLGSKNPDENVIWGAPRVDLATDVAPGESYTFSFPITAPASGSYNMQWQMMQRYVEWFGGIGSVAVTVNPPGSTDEVTYIHTDGLGSPVARTNASGAVVSRTSYEPYGRMAGGVAPTVGFTGHMTDSDTGLVYMQQRYYDPVAGRFLSVDPALTNAQNGNEFNRYLYAHNNPLRYIDPDGRMSEAICISMVGNCTSSGGQEKKAATMLEGQEAHRIFQNYAMTNDFNLSKEVTIRADNGDGKLVGRADLADKGVRLLWEIKPDSFTGYVSGNVQLYRYTNDTGWTQGDALKFLPVGDTVSLQGKIKTYNFSNSGNGLIIYSVTRPESALARVWKSVLKELANPGSVSRGGGLPGGLPPVFVP